MAACKSLSDASMSSSPPPPPLTTLALVESLTMPLVQEVELSADVKCKECLKRIADVISRLDAETESVVVNMMEKKVTLICRYPKGAKQITTTYKRPLAKISLLGTIFRSSSGSSH